MTEDQFEALIAFESRAGDPMQPFIEALRRCGHDVAPRRRARLDQQAGRLTVRLLLGIAILGVLADFAAAAVGLSDMLGILGVGVIFVVMAAFVVLGVTGRLPYDAGAAVVSLRRAHPSRPG